MDARVLANRDIMQRKTIIIGAVAAGLALAAIFYWSQPGETGSGDGARLAHVVDVKVPQLDAGLWQGKALFDKTCATCHGKNAAGGETGPPLVHRIYEPSHHADGSFYLAVRNGVRAHHWRFGDMPPQPDVSNDDVTKIIAYVRALQRANGIR